MTLAQIYRGKKVFLTGHTGFKGSWLTEWLLQCGARITGFALEPATQPALFTQLGLVSRLERHVIGDVRDRGLLRDTLLAAEPDFVFHLAAQPLVRESYRAPVETYEVNVNGTLHLLEALRALARPCAAVLVTTDKCYENRETSHAYREEDSLGGHDPYSSSKGAMEIAVASWRRSFFARHPVKIATARAGNVIGGGDWAADRIVPDCIRALQRGDAIAVRHPYAVRPWQHVLEPLGGYLWLAARLAALDSSPAHASAFNFGPQAESSRTVRELVETLLIHWPGTWADASDPVAVHEAMLLRLDIQKASAQLQWSPVWSFAETIQETTRWYREVSTDAARAHPLTVAQIETYLARAHQLRAPWAA